VVLAARELNKKLKKGLYLVSVPIGNPEDITMRGKNILENADIVYGEERKAGYRLIRSIGIKRDDLLFVNEHNEKETVDEIISYVKQGKSVAVFPDAGAPVFSDPGRLLVEAFQNRKLPVTVIPGASSLISGITLSGIDMNNFFFAGFLERDEKKRKDELSRLKKLRTPVFIMETPYRLQKLLNSIENIFGKEKKIIVLADLTMNSELVVKGNVKEIKSKFGSEKNKKPFVLIIP
jgi:16S rRNA (cytidine1402-2'-O)-methyltransferase